MLMHRTLKEMPGSHPEMRAVATHWHPASQQLNVANCGGVSPIIIRANQKAERLGVSKSVGLGGRSTPKPAEHAISLESGDRLVMVTNGVVGGEAGQAGLGIDGVIEAALRSGGGAAGDTIRKVHTAVLKAAKGDLADDATVVCLSVG